jgi:hypothetical protein
MQALELFIGKQGESLDELPVPPPLARSLDGNTAEEHSDEYAPDADDLHGPIHRIAQITQ